MMRVLHLGEAERGVRSSYAPFAAYRVAAAENTHHHACASELPIGRLRALLMLSRTLSRAVTRSPLNRVVDLIRTAYKSTLHFNDEKHQSA